MFDIIFKYIIKNNRNFLKAEKLVFFKNFFIIFSIYFYLYSEYDIIYLILLSWRIKEIKKLKKIKSMFYFNNFTAILFLKNKLKSTLKIKNKLKYI